MTSAAGRESSATVWPAVTVIVPAYNEAATISGKLQELRIIDYPHDRLRVVVVDGGSTDGTVDVLRTLEYPGSRIEPLFTTHASRAAQINDALAGVETPWVLVTDADARLASDALRRLVSAAIADDRIAVVGTPVVPAAPHPLDIWHWRASNWARRMEFRLGTTGLVVGPCYLFKRTLIKSFPLNSTADDVYTACAAAEAGARAALVDAHVRELRVAIDATNWFRQKLRRALGYLREVIRFLPRARHMRAPMREVFLWRATVLLAGPVVTVATLAAATATFGWPVPVLAASVAGAGAAIRTMPMRHPMLANIVLVMAWPIWIMAVTTAALLVYPFARPGAYSAQASLRPDEIEVC